MITTKGDKVRIIANAGECYPDWLMGPQILVKVRFAKAYMGHYGEVYRIASELEATGGEAEIQAAIAKAPKESLDPSEEREALSQAMC